jgi:hypothetical protein
MLSELSTPCTKPSAWVQGGGTGQAGRGEATKTSHDPQDPQDLTGTLHQTELTQQREGVGRTCHAATSWPVRTTTSRSNAA